MSDVGLVRNKAGQWVSGHEMPKEWRDKISVATKGSKNPFFNKKHTEETREKIKRARATQDMSWRVGNFKHSPETIVKISTNRKAVSTRGDKHHCWKGGRLGWLQNERKRLDNYTCAHCGLIDRDIMDADHIIPKSVDPKLKHDINNLQTLCPNCHKRKTLKERKAKLIH